MTHNDHCDHVYVINR